MEPVSDPRVYSNRYEVTHLIDRGGMAMVYRAQDLLLNRPVALKILYPELSADPLFVERFRREAQAAANLSHPNIVPVFDWGEDDGVYFIVMELIDGTSLDHDLRLTRTLTPARCAIIAAQVAAALGYAHRSGVVHRDVKPGNILLTADGHRLRHRPGRVERGPVHRSRFGDGHRHLLLARAGLGRARRRTQ
jgi:serine/threonine-protein kinase